LVSDYVETDRGSSERPKRLIRSVIERLDLDLSGLVVLTEAASGNYVHTPLVCAAAGCERVIAHTKDSAYGSSDAVIEATSRTADLYGLAGGISFAKEISADMWASADIVTNLGFLRPLDGAVVGGLKETACIPLMFETWEFREEDLDLRACWDRGICVLGTNEEHEAIRILDYLGALAAKKLFEQGIEITGSRIVVLGKGKFFFKVCGALEQLGAHVLRRPSGDGNDAPGAPDGGLEELEGADAIVLADEPVSTEVLVGSDGVITPHDIVERCPEATLVQLAGVVDRSELEALAIRCIPRKAPAPGHMGWSLSELGPRAVIDLHAAGLKVGELLARARLAGLGPKEAVVEALKNPLCQDFSPEQKRKFGYPY
jgi:hypothetical protein